MSSKVPLRVASVFGTRPEAIKLGPILRLLEDDPRFVSLPILTGQHGEILDEVIELFDIVPRANLSVLRAGQALAGITTGVLSGLEGVMAQEMPDVVVVQGDTTTTFAGALCGFYNRTPVVHVEAGLRSGDVYSPYPEEINRRLTTQLATLHLAPTVTARDALLGEAVAPDDIIVTGNSVIDALRATVAREVPWSDPSLGALEADPRPLLLVTAHRRESWGTGMAEIAEALAEIASERPDVLIVFPIHPNPTVRRAVIPVLARFQNARVIEPLRYGEFARLLARSSIILTDSGGIQEEAPSLGKPVLVMRDTTERREGVEAGTALLVGTDRAAITENVLNVLGNEQLHARMSRAVNPYGDGRAAERTLAALAHRFLEGPNVSPFVPA